MTPYKCNICYKWIIKEASGGLHPSPGSHDPAYHVAKAYHTNPSYLVDLK